MKKYFLFLLAPIVFGFIHTGGKEQVGGTIMQTTSFCGGAEMSAEELAELTKARPLKGKKCFVRKGNRNNLKGAVVASFLSDSAGNFMIYLPPGEYCVIDSRKYDKNYVTGLSKKYKKSSDFYEAADLECLKKWLAIPDLVFTVKKGEPNKITVTYHAPCPWEGLPCVRYTGPLPP